MLQIKNLQASYNGLLALYKVDLEVPTGKIIALIGGNGNGKSTTLRAIAGLNKADKGQIFFNNVEIQNIPAHKRVSLGISLVPEGRRLFSRLTVERNLELGAYTRNDQKEVEQTKEEMYALFPRLKERRTQLAGTMSGGEQQMLAVARGLMAKPKLLLLDEPSWGVAPLIVDEMFRAIKKINEQGVSVLLVEQNVKKALNIAQYGYVIKTGKILTEKPAQELLADPNLHDYIV